MVTTFFGRKKATKPFKEYHIEWIEILKNTLLPILRNSIQDNSLPKHLSTIVEMIHHHYQAYYQTLDLAAENDVAQLLFPGWRNSLEKPFLFLGDFHPCLFTNLLRSFLEDSDDSEEGQYDFINKPYQFAVAWRNASKNLMVKIEQIERGLRLMVPELNSRVRVLQGEFLERVAVEWVKYEGRKGNLRGEVEEALVGKMEEMTCAFLDANRIRRSVLSEIMGATNVYQAALFLEALSQFLVGFRDADLISEFERCKMPVD